MSSVFQRHLLSSASFKVLQKVLTSTSDHPHCFPTKIPPTSAVFSQFIVANKFIAHCRAQIKRLSRESPSTFFHSWAYHRLPVGKIERCFPRGSSRRRPLSSKFSESASFVAHRSHCAVSIMVKSGYGKVERAREGRVVVGENRKLAIADGDRDGWRFTGGTPG